MVFGLIAALGMVVAPATSAAEGSAAPGTIVGWGTDHLLGGTTAAVIAPQIAPAGDLAGRVVTQVSGADYHACALDSAGTVHCWGSDESGALGNGPGRADSPTPAQVGGVLLGKVMTQVVTGGNLTSCALDDQGQAYCWGNADGYGLLGTGFASDSDVPAKVDMTDVPGHRFSSIFLGSNTACGLAPAGASTTSGNAYCWGNGISGQLGDGTQVPAHYQPEAVGGGLEFTSISGGDDHVCALDRAGDAYCWGGLGNGLGLGNDSPDGSTVPVLVHPPALDPPRVTKWKAIAASGSATCALDSDDQAYCWGPYGLGNGTTQGSGIPVAVDTGVIGDAHLVSIDQHGGRACAIDGVGAAYCWGGGPLGDNTSLGASLVPVRVYPDGVLQDRALSQVSVDGPTVLAVVAGGAPPAGVPAAPTGVTGQAGDGQVTVSWAGAGTGEPPTGYAVTAFPGGNTCEPVPPLALTCTVSGLTNGTSYQFSVAATNANGASLPSTKSAPIVPLGPPGRPTGLNIVTTPNGPLARWVAPASNGGSPITGYTVSSDPAGARCAADPGTNPQCLLDGLTPGMPYTVAVSATNAIGTGPPSAPPTSFTVITAPTPPRGVTLVASSRQIDVSWQEPASDGGSPITGYCVWNGAFKSGCVGKDGRHLPVTGLTNGVAYQLTVVVTNAAFLSTGSAVAVATPGAVPSAPTLNIPVASNGAVTLTWLPPTDTGGMPIRSYVVTASPGGSSCTSTSAAVTTCTVQGLTNGATYAFTAVATNDAGPGAASNRVTATPRTVPDAPVITSVTPGNGTATVTWSAPNNGGSPIARYLVFSRPSGPTCTPTPLTATSCVVRGLTNETKYQFVVRATNDAGSTDSKLSAPATPFAIPSQPGALTVGNPNRTTATITWVAVVAASKYEIRIKPLNGSFGAWITTLPAKHSFQNLVFNRRYVVEVRAVNTHGSGAARSLTFRQGDWPLVK